MKGKKITIEDIPALVKAKGMRMDHFLKYVGISRIHFYLVRKGERPLIEERRKKINEILDINL
jgi:hypothetical protein